MAAPTSAGARSSPTSTKKSSSALKRPAPAAKKESGGGSAKKPRPAAKVEVRTVTTQMNDELIQPSSKPFEIIYLPSPHCTKLMGQPQRHRTVSDNTVI
jgi:hypothetical protein